MARPRLFFEEGETQDEVRKKIREHEERYGAYKKEREADVQGIYRKCLDEVKDPERYFSGLVRGFLENPEHHQLRHALGILIYAKRHHGAELGEDYDLEGGEIGTFDPCVIGYDMMEALEGETPRDFDDELKAKIQKASHGRLKRWAKEIKEANTSRFVSGRPRKCELVERSFTDGELRSFLDTVTDPHDRLCFIFMATLGLRPGELCKLRGEDFDRERRELRIQSAKGSYMATLRIPRSLADLLPHVHGHERIFQRSPKQLRDRFRIYREASGLDDVYLMTEPCGRAGTRNPRYRLSLHSLRHYAIGRVYSRCKDPLLTRAFARHRHLDTTEHYLKKSMKGEVESLIGTLAPDIIP